MADDTFKISVEFFGQ